MSAPWLAELFAERRRADVERLTDVLRAIAPFFDARVRVLRARVRHAAASTRWCRRSASRRSVAHSRSRSPCSPSCSRVAASSPRRSGYGPRCSSSWVVPAAIVFGRLLHRAERESRPHAGAACRCRSHARSSRTACHARSVRRSRSRCCGWTRWSSPSLLGTTQAGIYAAGTRYLLVGLFTAEAIMHVLGPRIERAARGQRSRRRPRSLYAIGTAWQTSITWSVYLIVIFFSTPLLRVFGPEYVAAGSGARVAGVGDADHRRCSDRPTRSSS